MALLAAVAGASMAEVNPIQDAVMQQEMAALRAAKATVFHAQKDLDRVDSDEEEKQTLRQTKMDVKEAKKVAAHPHSGPALADALMDEDDKVPADELGESAGAAQQAAQAAQQDASAAAETEGEEHANAKTLASVYDMAKALKPTDLLPEGWIEKFDAGSGKPYFENVHTKETTWDAPRSLVNIALTAAKGQMHMKQAMERMETKMRMMREGHEDLGESRSVAVKSCQKQTQMLGETITVAKKLRSTVESLSAKLNLTGEQQKLLKKLLAAHKVPELPASVMHPNKKAPAKKAAANKNKNAKHVNKKRKDLGESADAIAHQMPSELAEASALEQADDKIEDAKIAAAMKAEAQRVTKQFSIDQAQKDAVTRKAALAAAAAVDKRMSDEDNALMQSDRETSTSMHDIIGDQENLENEQALYRGSMTKEQLNKLVDPDIADMEKADLTSDDGVGFKPVNIGGAL